MAFPVTLPPRFTLTPQRKTELEATRAVIKEAEYRISQARDAGLDVKEQAEKIATLSRQVEGILRVYGK